jgi:rubredoxin
MNPELQNLKAAVENGKCQGIDGHFSPLTRRLVAKFNASGVDMTDFWIRTPQHWSCIGCGRKKEEIVRLNNRGQLICRLVEHHDHMKDLLLERFRQISAGQDKVVADEQAEDFAKRSAPMVSSYDNTVLCDDCNAADAKAKKYVGTHPRFSYSANEINQFVMAKPNLPHDINIPIAKRIWEENKDTFDLRLRIVDRIAQIAATNTHWYQSVHWNYRPDHIISASGSIINEFGVDYSYAYNLLRGENKQPQKDISSWRRKQITISRPPTEGEINHAAQVNSAPFWRRVDADWECQVCHRNKRQTVRLNNKKEWCFSTSEKTYRDSSARSGKQKLTLCHDCEIVAHGLAKEALSITGEVSSSLCSLVEPEDIASVIIPRPHSRHEIRNDEADLVVSKIISFIKDSVESELPDRF